MAPLVGLFVPIAAQVLDAPLIGADPRFPIASPTLDPSVVLVAAVARTVQSLNNEMLLVLFHAESRVNATQLEFPDFLN